MVLSVSISQGLHHQQTALFAVWIQLTRVVERATAWRPENLEAR